MALVSFSPNTVIKSADINANFTGVTNWSLLTQSSAVIPNFIVAGTGVVAISSGLLGTFSNVNYFISGQSYSLTSIANKTYTVSKDTYVDISTVGVTYTEVANGAASPALSANNIRNAKVVTNGSAITSITQLGSDSLSNEIAPQSNTTKLSLVRQDLTTNTYEIGNSVMCTGWSYINILNSTNTGTITITYPVTFLQRPIVIGVFGGDSIAGTTYGSGGNNIEGGMEFKCEVITATSFVARITKPSANVGSSGNFFFQWMAIGEVVK